MPIQDLPADARPREKLLARGAAALSDTELLALLLRTGTRGRGVFQMAEEVLLSGVRAEPTRLLAAGYRFRHPTLAGALEAALAANTGPARGAAA